MNLGGQIPSCSAVYILRDFVRLVDGGVLYTDSLRVSLIKLFSIVVLHCEYTSWIVFIKLEIPVFFKADKKQMGTKLANLNLDRTYFVISSSVIPISVDRSHLLIAICA